MKFAEEVLLREEKWGGICALSGGIRGRRGWGRFAGLSEPPLTCSSSHHMLTPPLATLSERTKFNLSGLMRRVQVLASLAIMLLTPTKKDSSKELLRSTPSIPDANLARRTPSSARRACRWENHVYAGTHREGFNAAEVTPASQQPCAVRITSHQGWNKETQIRK